MAQKTEIRKLKRRKIVLCVMRFFVSIAPIAVAVALNWGEYTRSVRSGISLAAGGVIALILIILKLLNRVPKKIHGVIKYGVVFVITYLLQDLLNDAVLLTGCAFVGELLDWAIFTIPIRKTEERIVAENSADVTSEKVSAKIEAMLNSKLGNL